MDEPTPTNAIERRGTRIILGSLVGCVVGLNYCCRMEAISGSAYHAVSGFIVSQPFLLAFWTAFASRRFYERFLWGFAVCTLVTAALELGALARNSFQLGIYISIDLVLFFATTAVLLVVRRLFRLRLTRSGEAAAVSDYQPSQFGIKHLLILTGITAVVCGTFRTLATVAPSFEPIPIGTIAEIVFRA